MLYQSFFSEDNIDRIQRDLAQRVYNYSGYSISPQDPTALRHIMEGVYEDNYTGRTDIREQLKHMNEVVLSICIPQVIQGAAMYIEHLKGLNAAPGEAPVPVSTKKWRSFNF